jgi:hypothetical protein
MKLMRHSDIKLTTKVYTDEMQLPIYDSIKGLPRLMNGKDSTQIRAQILGAEGQNVSQSDATDEGIERDTNIENRGDCHCLAQPVAVAGVERVKGIEPSLLA